MSFTFAGLLKLRPWPGVQIVVGAMAALILLDGWSHPFDTSTARPQVPFSIRHYAQHEVAVSRFLKHVVAGQEHPVLLTWNATSSTGLKAFPILLTTHSSARMTLIQSFICFCSDYDDDKILSFCRGLPFFSVMTEQDVWNANKEAIAHLCSWPKDLKLIWERDPKTERIIRMFQSLRDLGTEDSISFSFGGRVRTILRTEHP